MGNKSVNERLRDALQEMVTQFYAHDCLNNIDCRRCKALNNAESILVVPLEQQQQCSDALTRTIEPASVIK